MALPFSLIGAGGWLAGFAGRRVSGPSRIVTRNSRGFSTTSATRNAIMREGVSRTNTCGFFKQYEIEHDGRYVFKPLDRGVGQVTPPGFARGCGGAIAINRLPLPGF